MPKKLSETEKKEMIKSFCNGITIDQLSDRYKITINRHLKKEIDEKQFKRIIEKNNKNKSESKNEFNKKLDNLSNTQEVNHDEISNDIVSFNQSEFIEITDSVKPSNKYNAANGVISDPNGNDSGLIIKGRTVQLRASVIGPPKVKLFTYGVYPLYLVGKLMDNAKINNIVINEESLTFKKSTSPKLYFTQNSNGFIDDVSSTATNTNDPPTNFVEIDRLASAAVDTQNERSLRPTITKDIFYVGENQTKEVDMTKVFGVDRNVITPDNNNIEATFITAKQLGSGSNKFTQGSLNFREQ